MARKAPRLETGLASRPSRIGVTSGKGRLPVQEGSQDVLAPGHASRRQVAFRVPPIVSDFRVRHSLGHDDLQYQIPPGLAWERELLDAVPEVFAEGGRRRLAKEHVAKVRELRAKIGELTVERDFFGAGWRAEPGGAEGMIETGGSFSLSRQCALPGVSRSSLYNRPKGEGAEDLWLMRRMDELHMDFLFYGSRQMERHLGREGCADSVRACYAARKRASRGLAKPERIHRGFALKLSSEVGPTSVVGAALAVSAAAATAFGVG